MADDVGARPQSSSGAGGEEKTAARVVPREGDAGIVGRPVMTKAARKTDASMNGLLERPRSC